jgi:N-acyl-D-amino-acid deacylase
VDDKEESMRRTNTVAIVTLLAALVFTVTGGCGVQADVPSTGLAVPGMANVDSVVKSFMEKWSVPGVAVAIVKDGRLVFARGYGYADNAARTLVQPDSLFRIASVSKPTTAVAVLKLAEEGRLRLTDRAFAILNELEPPAGKTPDSRLQDITIEQLLTHTAGWDIAQLGYDPQFDLHSRAAEAFGVTPPADAGTIVRYMMGERLSFSPGSRYVYSNFGYNVLGRVVEAITGLSYEQYVESSILLPMGITEMRIGHTRLTERAAGEVKYYALAGGTTQSVFPGQGSVAWPDGGWYLEAMDAHGGWIGSAIDMMRFVTHVDGRPGPTDILTNASIQKMTARPAISQWNGSSWWYALGWCVNTNGNWWHDGSLDGTGSILVRASNGLSWFAVTNHRPRNWEDFNLAMDNMMWESVNGVTSWPAHDLFGQY